MATNTTDLYANTPKYNTTTGLLTAYGKSLGLPEKNTNVIPATSLTGTKPYTLPTATMPVFGGLEGATEGLINSTKSQAQMDLEASKVKTDSSFQDYISELINSGSISSSVNRSEQDAAKKKADEYTAQLEAEQLSNRRQIENLQKNSQGLFGGGVEQEINRINRDSLSKQADIAILQTTANRQYDTAASIADRQVQMKLEQSQANLAGLKFFYEENKADFDKADERLYSEKIRAEEAALKKQTDTENTIKEIKLTAVQNGAGADVLSALSAIDTSQPDAFDQALKIASSYLGNNQVVKLENGNTIMVDNQGKIVKNFGGSSSKSDPNSPQGGMFNSLVGTVSNLEGTVAGKEAVKNQMNTYLQSQDYDSAYNQIANTVETSLVGDTKTRFANARVDYEVLSGFRTALQAYQDAGGDTGLLKGTAESITRNLGSVKDPALTSLAVQLQREFQSYRQAMTGAAFTSKESNEYASVNPTSNKSLNLNLAVIDGALSQLKNRVDGTIRAKVPQVSDILKLTNISQTEDQAKAQVNSIYTSVDSATKSVIENLFTNDYSNADVLEYLKIKGII